MGRQKSQNYQRGGDLGGLDCLGLPGVGDKAWLGAIPRFVEIGVDTEKSVEQCSGKTGKERGESGWWCEIGK